MLKRLFALCSGLVLATAASAGPVVPTWTYSLNATWSAATGASGVGSQTLSWGTSFQGGALSSLVITDPPANGSLTTYVGGGLIPPAFWSPGVTVTHNNNIITNSTFTGATLTANLTLIDPANAPNPGALPSMDVVIKFLETPNTAGNCAVATNGTPCDDIFVVLSGLPNQNFSYDGNDYFLNIFPTNAGSFQPLSAAACAAVGQAAGCIGFTTEESHATIVPFSFTISTREASIPEPGTLALVGFSMLGFGLARRRRH